MHSRNSFRHFNKIGSLEINFFFIVKCFVLCIHLNVKYYFRKETIFSIDPETARDLDDAVSIKKISSNKYEVGVHISDVSYFLQEGTPLDEKVSERATTIYMVDRVNHMLPIQLCMLCSLLPGEDKFAFSVIWEMTEEGEHFDD